MYTLDDIKTAEIKPFLDRERDRREFEYIIRSISDIGLKIPITVRPIKPKKKKKKELKRSSSRIKYYRYEIVKGHGRFNAIRELGWETIPAFVIEDLGEIELIKLFLMENEVRKSMSAYERACLMESDYDVGMTILELARKYRLHEKTVLDNLATLHSISAGARRKLSAGHLSLDDAKTVSSFSKAEQDTILRENLKSTELRSLSRSLTANKTQTRAKITRKSMVDNLIGLKDELEGSQTELQRLNRLYLWSVANLRSVLRDNDIVRKLKKHKINLDPFKPFR